jgi:prepilin-type processing-associated H-X9-DG protein
VASIAPGKSQYYFRPMDPDASGSQTAWQTTCSWWNYSGGWEQKMSATDRTYAEMTLGFEWSSLGQGPTTNALRPGARVSDQLSARHANVMNAAFCDGHVAQLRGDMDTDVFKHLMTPYGIGYVNLVDPTLSQTAVDHPIPPIDDAMIP